MEYKTMELKTVQNWELFADGRILDTYDTWADAYDALVEYVGGDDFCTRESCDGGTLYGYRDEAEAAAAQGTDCAYSVGIRRAGGV
jgi:hypothetical protein